MTDDTTAKTLRDAAARLRETATGTTRADLARPGLGEPLADLLDEIARQYEMPPCDSPNGACNGCERRDDFVHAEHLARAILGEVAR